MEGSGAVEVARPEYTNGPPVTQTARSESISSSTLTDVVSVAYGLPRKFCDAKSPHTDDGWHRGVGGEMPHVRLGTMVHQTPSIHRYSTASGQFRPSEFGSD